MTATGPAFAAAVLAAALPDPGDPLFVAFCGAVAGFLAGLKGLIERRDRDSRLGDIAIGAWWGTGGGLALYVLGLTTGLY